MAKIKINDKEYIVADNAVEDIRKVITKNELPLISRNQVLSGLWNPWGNEKHFEIHMPSNNDKCNNTSTVCTKEQYTEYIVSKQYVFFPTLDFCKEYIKILNGNWLPLKDDFYYKLLLNANSTVNAIIQQKADSDIITNNEENAYYFKTKSQLEVYYKKLLDDLQKQKNIKVNTFKKKPVSIEAIQLTSYSIEKIKEWVGDDYDKIFSRTVVDVNKRTEIDSETNPKSMGVGLKIQTLEGVMLSIDGDYIIKGVDGEFYSCKKDIFEKTYEAA